MSRPTRTPYELLTLHAQLASLVDDLRGFADWDQGTDDVLMAALNAIGLLVDRGLR